MPEAIAKTAVSAPEISVEHTSNLEKDLTIIISEEQIADGEAKEFRKLSKHAQIKGYRKGKVPISALKRHYADSVRSEVVGQLVKAAVDDALAQHDFQVVENHVEIDIVEDEKGKPLKIKAKFEVFPEIDLSSLDQLKLERFNIDISEEDLNQKLEEIRTHHANWLPTQESAREGDRVRIDYEGQLDGKVVKIATDFNEKIVIGREQMLPDFERQLIGVKMGDERSFDVTFPADYGMAELSGKTLNFNVKVHEVSVIQLPELDDNLAKKAGFELSLQELKEAVKKQMIVEAKRITLENMKHQLIEKLIEQRPFDLPKKLVESEIGNMQKLLNGQFSKASADFSFAREPLEKKANKRVAAGLVFMELIKKYDIKLTESAMKEKINEMFSSKYGSDEKTTALMLQVLGKNENFHKQMAFSLMEDQVIDKVLEEIQVQEKPISYSEAKKWEPEE